MFAKRSYSKYRMDARLIQWRFGCMVWMELMSGRTCCFRLTFMTWRSLPWWLQACMLPVSLSLEGFWGFRKKGLIFFFWKRTKRMFLIVRMPPLHLLLAAAIFLPGQVSSIFLLSWILMLKTPLDSSRLCPKDFLAILMLKKLIDCVPKIFLLSWCWRTF